MNTLVKAHAFNVGYDIFAIITSDLRNQTQLIDGIRARLDYLDTSADFSQELLYESNGTWTNLQNFLQKISLKLQVKHGDMVASCFMLPANVFVTISNLPIQDFAAVEVTLHNVELPLEIVQEFQDIKHKYNVGVFDGLDPQPLVGWINRVHEYFSKIAAKGNHENSQKLSSSQINITGNVTKSTIIIGDENILGDS